MDWKKGRHRGDDRRIHKYYKTDTFIGSDFEQLDGNKVEIINLVPPIIIISEYFYIYTQHT